jgi:hypothetical protein
LTAGNRPANNLLTFKPYGVKANRTRIMEYIITFEETTMFATKEELKSFVDMAVCHNKDISKFQVKRINESIDSNITIYNCNYFKIYKNGHIVLKNQKVMGSDELTNVRMFPKSLTMIEEGNNLYIKFITNLGTYYIRFNTANSTFEFEKESK